MIIVRHLKLIWLTVFIFECYSSVGQDIPKLKTVLLGDSSKSFSPNKKLTLTGTIKQAGSKLPLSGAAIFLDGYKIGDNSDANGRYVIQVPSGRYRISVRYLGNQPIQTILIIHADGVLDFEMNEKPETLEEVVIKSSVFDKNIKEVLPGVVKLNIVELKKIPALFGEVDIIRNLQLLPGVSSVGEGSAGFNVRGGRVDQNLVLMDEGQILNASHALGLLSNFNPDVVEDFTLYKGNIPAQFGGRASSVLSVRTRNGDFTKFKAKGGVGLLSERVSVEGPIFKDRTSFLAATRFSYSDWILKSVNNIDVKNSAASFYDLNGNLTHKIGKGSSLSLIYYLGSDYFRFSSKFGYEYSTQLITLRWKQILGKQIGSTFSAVTGNYDAKLFDFDIKNARIFSNGVSYLKFKENLLHTVDDKNALNIGAEVTVYSLHPEKSTSLGTNSTIVSQKIQKSGGVELAIYADDELKISKSLSLSLGLRYSQFQNKGPDTTYQYQQGASKSISTIVDTVRYTSNQVIKSYGGLEPRFSIRLALTANSSVKASYTRLRQYIHLISNTTATTPVDIWQVSNKSLLPQVADNFSLGYFHNLRQNTFELSGEVFYKTTSNIVDYKDFSQILLNRHLETDVLQGEGKSYGLELYAKKNSGGWTGWISYTFMRSLIKVDGLFADEKINFGNWYASSYDKPHTISFTASHRLGKNMRFGSTFNFSTGRPVSAIETYYTGSSIGIPVFSERNKYRIPDYWRLDISITINSIFKKIDDNLIFSIYNLLGRGNAYSVYYQQPDGVATLQSYKLSILGSALPSITYTLNF